MSILIGVSAFITAVVAVVTLGAGYVQFILKRTVIPAEIDIDFATQHQGSTLFGEIDTSFKNHGQSVIIVTDARYRVRWRSIEDSEDPFEQDPTEPRFPHVLSPPNTRHDGTTIFHTRTFIPPGVTQHYRKPIAIPGTPTLIHIWGAFSYRIEVGRISRLLVNLIAKPPSDFDWQSGMVHTTVRRTFPGSTPSEPGPEPNISESLQS